MDTKEYFCAWCTKEEDKAYFILTRGDLDNKMEFCSPKCLHEWIIDIYED